MIKKSEIELERAAMIKTARTLIRLKHALQADRELNEALPDLYIQFEKAAQNGELLTLPIPEVDDVTTTD